MLGSTSRYLQQHASNPVEWYPWSDAAFAQARKQNKPIFLSIGYSTCHWCHVMERESFSDPEVAKLMNDAFVSIKVDREERPDLDAVYLAVTRTLTGDAGWPNNVILTPDGKPFFAASYIPKEKFRALIPRISAQWSEQRERVVANAEMIVRSLQSPPSATEALTAGVLTKGYQQLVSRYDAKHGGFLPAPKFPKPHDLLFLLRYWNRTHDAKALEMVETTLRAMRNGPLWDKRNGGFHRYATNEDWSEPHYEKMLYDQALLALANLEAYQATGRAEYAQTARAIFAYVLRDLRSPSGAFFAAQDADEAYYTGRRTAKPGRDEKLIADWNGLMIAALSFGANVLHEPSYAAAATKAADVIIDKRRRFLDDYAFLVWGLLNLYEATFDVRHLQAAIALNDEAVKLFCDATTGRFYITANDAAEALLVRPRETGDGAIPSGNSVELMNLVRLSRITARPEYATYAEELVRSASDEVSLAPSASTFLLSALDFHLGPSQEIVLSGRDVSAFQRAVFARYAPNKVVLHRPPGAAPSIVKIAPYTEPQRAIAGKATAYVCENYSCKLPVT
ncbi:MAG TPA: thioredoxin domain-containing protein, partial [Thermoanaerobaculia bacterium]|nr:thioredoxin domain-containing protein [Thermoanaerobaculia bacterium]